MLKRTSVGAAALLLVATSVLPSAGAPEGQWPIEAMDGSLPRPEWVVVLPARRGDDGGLVVWDRADPWTRDWVVPRRTPGGLRTVAVTGDAEDRRLATATQLDGMDASALARIAGKYGAGAVAVVVADAEGRSAVAAWSRGAPPVWLRAFGSSDPRTSALAAIDAAFAGLSTPPPAEATYGPSVTITGVRDVGFGDEFRVEADDASTIDALSTVPGLLVLERLYGGLPAAVVAVTDGGAIEDVLRRGGIGIDPAL